MARSSWKFNYINSYVYKNLFLSKFRSFKAIKFFCRSAIIPKIFFKKTVLIYKGNIFAKIIFNKYHIGFKFGEFSVTRKPFNFPLKNTKKTKR